MAQRTRCYLVRRTVVVLLTLFVVTLLSFLLMRLSPIDPATAYVKHDSAVVTQEQINETRVVLDLSKPLPMQCFDWIVGVLHVDSDISLGTGNPVTEELVKIAPATLTVAAYPAVTISLGVLGVGMLGYPWRQKAGGMILSFLTMIGISVPGFYLGIAFIDLFAVRLGWISVSGDGGFARYFPVAPYLSVLEICFYGQMLAASLERGMEQDYAIYLRCRGLRERHTLLFRAFPHAVVDLLSSFARMLGLYLTNAAIVERVFSLSGLDYLIIDAVVKQDSSVIHAAALVLALTLVLLDTAAEFLQYGLRSDVRAMGGRT